MPPNSTQVMAGIQGRRLVLLEHLRRRISHPCCLALPILLSTSEKLDCPMEDLCEPEEVEDEEHHRHHEDQEGRHPRKLRGQGGGGEGGREAWVFHRD